MGKIYTTTKNSLMEFIVDINNKYKINISSEDEIKRLPIRKGEPSYQMIFKESYHKEFIPVYNIMNDSINNKTFLYLDIPDISLILKLKFSNSSTVCAYSFLIPSKRIINEINISSLLLSRGNIYEETEEYIYEIISNHIYKSLSSIFNKEVEDVEKQFLLKGSFDLKLEKKVNI